MRSGSRSPFLKKRSVSTVFDIVEVVFGLGVRGTGVDVGARMSFTRRLP
jgi:hypothetical protein